MVSQDSRQTGRHRLVKQYFKNFAIAAVLILAAVFACGGSDTESVRVVETVVVERQVTQIEKVVETVVVEKGG